MIPADGGEPRLVASTNAAGCHSASFSPKGGQLAYVTCGSFGACRLEVRSVGADLRPSGPARAVAQVATGGLDDLVWSRDGESLMYTSAPAFAGRLWRVRVDGGSPPDRVELAGIGVRTAAVASGRDRLAFSQQRSVVSLHPLDTTLTSPAVLSSSSWDIDARFSPDGRTLAFSSTRSGEAMETWLAQADGSDARQLTHGPGRWQGSPAWSPDGRRLTFDSQQADGNWSVWVVDLEGGAPREITHDPGDENKPVWSPDGQWIYFGSADGRRGVRRVVATGGPIEQVAAGPTAPPRCPPMAGKSSSSERSPMSLP